MTGAWLTTVAARVRLMVRQLSADGCRSQRVDARFRLIWQIEAMSLLLAGRFATPMTG
jgi:hypothetical protein